MLLLTKQNDLWGNFDVSNLLRRECSSGGIIAESDQRLIKFHSHSEKLTRRDEEVSRTTNGGSIVIGLHVNLCASVARFPGGHAVFD